VALFARLVQLGAHVRQLVAEPGQFLARDLDGPGQLVACLAQCGNLGGKIRRRPVDRRRILPPRLPH